MPQEYLLTSESVSEGHPDKVADQISDAVLDAVLARDPYGRVACETLVTGKLIHIAGEISADTNGGLPFRDIALGVIDHIGYTAESYGYDIRDLEVLSSIREQCPDITMGVVREDGEVGAGDQGMMFGYATDETPELMPLGISLAHKLLHRQSELRRQGILKWLRPDAKAQVTVRYNGYRPVSIEAVVLSTQHDPDVKYRDLREAVIADIIEHTIPPKLRARNIVYHVNPTGRFVTGGPAADTGLTGRKIIVDTYGGACPHGGGAFSGKDATKVDRSAAYMARYLAKNVVAAGLAERCTVQVAYAIGVAEPVSIMFDLAGTGKVDESHLEGAIRQVCSLKPRAIIDTLALRRPIFGQTAAYGHFGRELPAFKWENRDLVPQLQECLRVRR